MPTDLEQRQYFYSELNKVPPPFLPRPRFNPLVFMIGSACGGAGVGLVTGVFTRLPETTLIWWVVLGFIDGGIFGGICSLIYNSIVRRSNYRMLSTSTFPEAKDLPDEQVSTSWTDLRAANLLNYIRENFQEKIKQN